MAKYILIIMALLVFSGVICKNTETETPATTDITTTSEDPETTTEPDTTTTTSTTPTTPATTTTAPPVPGNYNYNVTEERITCIMLDGDISFTVNYATDKNETKESVVKVPRPSDAVSVEGSCSDIGGTQHITISWGPTPASSNITLVFNSTSTKMWRIIKYTSKLAMNDENFPHNIYTGHDLYLDIDLQPFEIPINHSYKCMSNTSAYNVTGLIDKAPYTLPMYGNLVKLQLQAFNQIANETDFLDSIHCEADKTSDIVPIAVGCALAVLVIIVLIAYLIGRRRRSAAYQSV